MHLIHGFLTLFTRTDTIPPSLPPVSEPGRNARVHRPKVASRLSPTRLSPIQPRKYDLSKTLSMGAALGKVQLADSEPYNKSLNVISMKYCVTGKFGGELNLAVRRSMLQPPT